MRLSFRNLSVEILWWAIQFLSVLVSAIFLNLPFPSFRSSLLCNPKRIPSLARLLSLSDFWHLSSLLFFRSPLTSHRFQLFDPFCATLFFPYSLRRFVIVGNSPFLSVIAKARLVLVALACSCGFPFGTWISTQAYGTCNFFFPFFFRACTVDPCRICVCIFLPIFPVLTSLG